MRRFPRPARRVPLTVALGTLLVASTLALGALQFVDPPVSGADEVVRDGTISERAGASCWSIKQGFPSSVDGTYWVQTEALVAPMRVYCDMTTDGGGWVLIGRGRDGWNWSPTGQGAQSQIATTVTGTSAFAPAAYSNTIVNGLLNNGRVDALADGIRLRRATNTAGSAFQEVRWRIQPPVGSYTGRPRWTWAFGTGLPIDSGSVGGTAFGKANTFHSGTVLGGQGGSNLGLSGLNSWITHNNYFNARRGGFGFSAALGGDTSATNFFYYSGPYTVPFTQVWIRPQISEPTLPAIGSGGTSASTVRTFLKSKPEALNWGVATNSDPNDQFPDLNSHVMGFAQIGNTVYVGGEFQHVRNGLANPLIPRAYLAAFDATTGAWRSNFLPVVNGTVFDVRATPDGKLLIGGSFTSVNGQPNTSGLAAVDPVTGATDTSWTASLSRVDGSNKAPVARTMEIKGPWLYVGGYFTAVNGGVADPLSKGAGNLVRVAIADGRPDPAWNPTVGANLFHLSPSPSSDKLWLAGNFVSINGQFARRIGAVSMTDGTRADPALMPNWQPSQPLADPTVPAECCEYQYTIMEYQGSVWNAGSQHNLHKNRLSDYQLERSSITSHGGDFQGMGAQDGIVYAGCHCTNFEFTDQNQWTFPMAVFGASTSADAINSFGAWDSSTGEYIADFYPELYTTVGEGPWEFFTDAAGCMWVGGDFDRGGWNGTGYDYVGGFAKFCNRDTVAPSTPTNIELTSNGGRAQLKWAASTDNASTPVRYEILRDDRVVATVWGLYYLDPEIRSGNYFIRAVDETGNRSASTSVQTFVTPTAPATLVTSNATWAYTADGSNQGTAWREPGTSLATWPTAPASLGANLGQTTTIATTGVTQYFANDFTVANLATVASLSLQLQVDDGAVVYLNGQEVARHNMPFGTPLFTTPAWSASTGAPPTLQFNLPKSQLVTGTNRLAVEVHQSAANDVDAFFSASLTGFGPSADTTPPSAPTVTTGPINNTSVQLNWTASADNVGTTVYEIRRNGVLIAYRQASATRTYLDQQLTAGTAYNYSVIAHDVGGNQSAAGTVTATTTGGFTAGIVSPSQWRYSATGDAPPAGWQLPATSLAAWPQGSSPLGKALGETTTIATPSITQYFAQDFNVPNVAQVATYQLQLRADDGAVVYLNGNEVARSNMPFGAPAATTPAWAAQTTAPGLLTYRLPKDFMVSGTNRVAVEVHQTAANDVDAFMDATLVASPLTTDTTPPSAPAVTPTNLGRTSVRVNYTASVDNVGTVVYRIQRNGQTITFRQGSSARNYLDQQLTPGATYTYTVVGIDIAGNESPAGSMTVTMLP